MGLKADLKLTACEAALMSRLPLDTDVSIEDLFGHLYPGRDETRRRKQSYVGSFVCKINKKLDGEKIRPGDARYSYRRERA